MSTPNANRLPTFKRIPAQNPSTGKKAAAESNSQWKRKHLQSVAAEEKEQVVKKIRTCIGAGAKVGRDIVVGFNSVMRLIERDDAEVVCVAQDGHPTLLKSMVEAAKAKQIGTVTVPKLNQSVRKELSLKSASCFALRKTQQSSENIDETASASIDDLKEYLLAL
jgi:ribosomal protein L7Ae-like RNA K-turn-binding protein